MKRSKSSLIQSLTVTFVAVMVVGCASKDERELASGGFNYEGVVEGKTIKIPEGIDSPEFSDEYDLPQLGENAPRDLTGQRLPVRSPNLVLPVVSGSHVTGETKTATVSFDKVDDSQPLDQTIWNSLLAFLEEQGIGVDTFDPENQRLVTDWMIITSEDEGSWYDWTTTSSEIGRRFEFSLDLKSHGRSATLNTQLVDFLSSSGDTVTDKIDVLNQRREEVDILNQVINHYDYQIRLANSLRIQEIRQGFNMEMGFDEDGEPAFVMDAEYDIAWPRMQLVLRKLGFDVKDLDKSNGLLFVTYAGPDSSWWQGWFDSDNEMPLDQDDYRIHMRELGDKTSITFMDAESTPFPANQVVSLFPPFSEVMSDNDLDI